MSAVDIAGRHYGGATSIDTSNFLTFQKGNNMYVNEEGDKMRGSLDMSKNKIINVAVPNEINDASNKFYVDDQIRRATTRSNELFKQRLKAANDRTDELIKQRFEDELKLKIEKNRLPEDIVSKEVLDNAIRDERQSINTQFLDNKGIIRSDKLPPKDESIKQHFFILNIDESHGASYTISKFQIPLSTGIDKATPLVSLNDTPTSLVLTSNITKQMIHLQLTAVLNTTTYHDEIFMNIQRYDITFEGLDVYILTVRSTNTGWGLYLQAHLTVTINVNNIPVINAA